MDGQFVMRCKSGYKPRALLLPLALLLLSGLPAHPCRADSPWSASIDATTDYIFRGVSQTYDSGALQLGANYQSSLGWFAGVWASNVNPYPHAGSSTELDLYAGFAQPLGADFSTRVAYTHYAYLDDPRPARYDYDEVALSVAYVDRLAATLSYEPDSSAYSTLGFAQRRPTGALELTGRWPLCADFALTGGAGYYNLQRLFGTSYWAADVGLAYVYRRVTIEVSRFFAESTVERLFEDQSANGTWTVSASLRF
jgi:uncharacterized protein (TIGR02001 family)